MHSNDFETISSVFFCQQGVRTGQSDQGSGSAYNSVLMDGSVADLDGGTADAPTPPPPIRVKKYHFWVEIYSRM